MVTKAVQSEVRPEEVYLTNFAKIGESPPMRICINVNAENMNLR